MVQFINLFKGCQFWCLGAEGGAGLTGGQYERRMFWLGYVMLCYLRLCLLTDAVIFFSFGTLLYFFVNVLGKIKLHFSLS